MKRIIPLLAILALVATGCATTSIGTSPKGEELPIEKAAIKFAADVKDGGYKTIGADGLAKLLAEKKNLIIIDTMPADAFAKSHIKGAVNAPVPKAENELTPADKAELYKTAGADKNAQIITYCGFTSCRRSHIAAKLLIDEGYKDVTRYPAGIVGWLEGNFPVEPDR